MDVIRPKLRPQTNYIEIKYHHFRDKVKNGIVKV